MPPMTKSRRIRSGNPRGEMTGSRQQGIAAKQGSLERPPEHMRMSIEREEHVLTTNLFEIQTMSEGVTEVMINSSVGIVGQALRAGGDWNVSCRECSSSQ